MRLVRQIVHSVFLPLKLPYSTSFINLDVGVGVFLNITCDSSIYVS